MRAELGILSALCSSGAWPIRSSIIRRIAEANPFAGTGRPGEIERFRRARAAELTGLRVRRDLICSFLSVVLGEFVRAGSGEVVCDTPESVQFGSAALMSNGPPDR